MNTHKSPKIRKTVIRFKNLEPKWAEHLADLTPIERSRIIEARRINGRNNIRGADIEQSIEKEITRLCLKRG